MCYHLHQSFQLLPAIAVRVEQVQDVAGHVRLRLGYRDRRGCATISQ
jgi:hypothetical protein